MTHTENTHDDWREAFKASSLKVGFILHLTRPQLEMLCATADDVEWDRDKFSFIGLPSNWISTEAALERKGLLQRKPDLKITSYHNKKATDRQKREAYDRYNAERKKHKELFGVGNARYELTPAGKIVVQLVVMSGMFIEAEDAMVKKIRRAK